MLNQLGKHSLFGATLILTLEAWEIGVGVAKEVLDHLQSTLQAPRVWCCPDLEGSISEAGVSRTWASCLARGSLGLGWGSWHLAASFAPAYLTKKAHTSRQSSGAGGSQAQAGPWANSPSIPSHGGGGAGGGVVLAPHPLFCL